MIDELEVQLKDKVDQIYRTPHLHTVVEINLAEMILEYMDQKEDVILNLIAEHNSEYEYHCNQLSRLELEVSSLNDELCQRVAENANLHYKLKRIIQIVESLGI